MNSSVDLIVFSKSQSENERNRDLRSKLSTLEGALKMQKKAIRDLECVEPMIGVPEGMLKKGDGEESSEMAMVEEEESTEPSQSDEDAFVEVASSDEGSEPSRSY